MKLQISAETGFRPIEILELETKDIDLEKRLLDPTAAKNGNNQKGKVSIKLRNPHRIYAARAKA